MKNLGNFRKGFVPLTIVIGAVVFFVALFAGGAVVVIQKSSPSLVTSDASSLPTDSSQTKTYTNSEYGFSIEYPADGADPAVPIYATPGPFLSSPLANIDLGQVVVDGKLVADRAHLSVTASSNAKDTKNCLVPGEIHNVDPNPDFPNPVYAWPSKTSTVTINGITFAESDYGAPNQAGLERNYTTLRNGLCFAIQIITIPSCSLCTSGPEAPSLHYDALAAMDVFARTFKFTGTSSAVSAPVMNTYTNTQFGYSFEYPNTLEVKSLRSRIVPLMGEGSITTTFPDGTVEVPGIVTVSKIPYVDISRDHAIYDYRSCCSGERYYYDAKQNAWHAETIRVYSEDGTPLSGDEQFTFFPLFTNDTCSLLRSFSAMQFYRIKSGDEGIPDEYQYFILTNKGYALKFTVDSETYGATPLNILSSVKLINGTSALTAQCV